MKRYIIIVFITFFARPFFAIGQSYDDIYVEALYLDSFNINEWLNNTRGNDIRAIESNKKNNSFSRNGWTHDCYNFEYKGIPLEFASVRVHKKDGVVTSLNGNMYSDLSHIDVTPSVSEELALQSALKFVGAKQYSWEKTQYKTLPLDETIKNKPQAELVICPIYKTAKERIPCLTYKFNIMAIEPFSYMSIYVDAHNGDVVHTNSLINYSVGTAQTRYSETQMINTTLINNLYYLHDLDRGIYTYNNFYGLSYNVSNALEVTDNDTVWGPEHIEDEVALDAHWGAMMTYDYFYYTFGRNSLDDKGMDINGYINCEIYNDENNSTYEKATWVQLNGGNGYAAYGIGGPYFNPGPFTSLDIVAHELGHGITRATANLEYGRESGAISEAISDIWGACVENYVNNGQFLDRNKDIWLYGEDIYMHNRGMRCMSYPPLHGLPTTYNYIEGGWVNYPSNELPVYANDFCGVHTNCSVMDYWFYLLSVGGNGINGNNYNYTVTGIGIDNAAQVVYNALCNYFTSSTNYENAAILTRASAIELFGLCSDEVQSVTDAWKAVGVSIDNDLDTLNIIDTVSAGGKGFFANSLINAYNIVNCGATACYATYGEIRFLPCFRAEKGSRVIARISTCQGNNASSPPLMRVPAYYKASYVENNSSMSPHIIVAPNPVVDIIYIKGLGVDNFSFVIFDAMGKVRKTGTIFAPYQISVIDLPIGTYVLRINRAEHNEYFKFIKE